MFSEEGTTPTTILNMMKLKLTPLDSIWKNRISTKKCGYEIISQELVQIRQHKSMVKAEKSFWKYLVITQITCSDTSTLDFSLIYLKDLKFRVVFKMEQRE